MSGFVGAVVGVAPWVQATVKTWDGGAVTNTWTQATNWVDDVAPVAGDDLVFPDGAARLANFNSFPASTAFSSFRFSGGSYTLTGSRVVLSSGITCAHAIGINSIYLPIQLSASQTITNSASGSLYFLVGGMDLNGFNATFGIGAGECQFSSPITGTGAVIKTGPMALYLANSNSFSGVLEVRQGTLYVQHGSALGMTNGNTTLYAGAIMNAGGTFTNAESLVLHGTMRIGGFTFGTNTWTGPVTLMATNVIFQAQGSARANLNGPISGTGGLSQTGPGTLALNGTNTYTGTTSNSAGILIVNGHQPVSPIVLSGGTLTGTGTVGTVTASGGTAKTVAPGGSPGILSCSNVSLSGTTTFRVALQGTTPGTGHSQLNVTGTVNLGSCILSNVLSYTAANNDSFVLINNDGADPVVGTFNALPQGRMLTNNGIVFHINYAGGDGNDVVLSHGPPRAILTAIAVPANGQAQLQGAGLATLNYTIQAATNLTPVIQWSNLGVATADAGGFFAFTDTNAPFFPMRFYRARSP